MFYMLACIIYILCIGYIIVKLISYFSLAVNDYFDYIYLSALFYEIHIQFAELCHLYNQSCDIVLEFPCT